MIKNHIAIESTILLVDDEIEILEYTKEEISPEFSKVILAKDGFEACDLLKSNKVDLIVTDYAMPKMNGLQLINFVKENYPLIPVIMLTGNGANPEVLEALKNGAFDILDKPFRTPVLVNRIQNGLLVPELTKSLWEMACRDLSLVRREEFLRKPLKEQHRIMQASNSVARLKSINRADDEGKAG